MPLAHRVPVEKPINAIIEARKSADKGADIGDEEQSGIFRLQYLCYECADLFRPAAALGKVHHAVAFPKFLLKSSRPQIVARLSGAVKDRAAADDDIDLLRVEVALREVEHLCDRREEVRLGANGTVKARLPRIHALHHAETSAQAAQPKRQQNAEKESTGSQRPLQERWLG